jgi:hypothetical protein
MCPSRATRPALLRAPGRQRQAGAATVGEPRIRRSTRPASGSTEWSMPRPPLSSPLPLLALRRRLVTGAQSGYPGGPADLPLQGPSPPAETPNQVVVVLAVPVGTAQSGCRPSPTLPGAPLAQRQSNGLLIRRLGVRIPRGAPRTLGERGRTGRRRAGTARRRRRGRRGARRTSDHEPGQRARPATAPERREPAGAQGGDSDVGFVSWAGRFAWTGAAWRHSALRPPRT